MQRLVRTHGQSWGIDAVGNWSSLGLLLLLASILSFLAEPVANTFSRDIEHQADVYGQEVIHGLVPDPQATTVSSFCADAIVWLDDPHPNRFVALRSLASRAEAAVPDQVKLRDYDPPSSSATRLMIR